jgi:ribonuclease P protein subunit RPR2
MVRIARERVDDLFAEAEAIARTADAKLADRYVRLARRVGMRHNVRLLPEHRENYCRGCSAYWVEGRTVRTRLRRGHRVRTCLACGRARRTVTHRRGLVSSEPPSGPPGRTLAAAVPLEDGPGDEDDGHSFDDESEDG